MPLASKLRMPTAVEALPGRQEPMDIASTHVVNGAPLRPPFPSGTAQAIFAMGCFWGAERKFWQTPGVVTTAVGYAGGFTPKASERRTKIIRNTDQGEVTIKAKMDDLVMPEDVVLVPESWF